MKHLFGKLEIIESTPQATTLAGSIPRIEFMGSLCWFTLVLIILDIPPYIEVPTSVGLRFIVLNKVKYGISFVLMKGVDTDLTTLQQQLYRVEGILHTCP